MTLLEFCDSLEKRFLEALKQYNVTYVGGNRIDLCLKYLREVKNAQHENRKPKVPADFGDFDAMCDLAEIDQLLRGISGEEPSIISIKLEKVLKGSYKRFAETNGNQEARNIQFELMLLADLKTVGLNAHLKEPNPDIEVETGGVRIPIECKRILTVNGIESNLRKAADQLNNIYVLPNMSEYGVVALSMDRAFTRKEVNVRLRTQSFEAAKVTVGNEAKKIMNQYQRLWKDPAIIKSEKTAAILFHVGAALQLDKKEGSYLTMYGQKPTLSNPNSLAKWSRFQNTDFSALFAYSGYAFK